jgi:hypothetical protein
MSTKARKIAAPKQISADEFMLEFNRLVAKHLSKTPQDQQLRRPNEVLSNFAKLQNASRKKRSAPKQSRKRGS